MIDLEKIKQLHHLQEQFLKHIDPNLKKNFKSCKKKNHQYFKSVTKYFKENDFGPQENEVLTPISSCNVINAGESSFSEFQTQNNTKVHEVLDILVDETSFTLSAPSAPFQQPFTLLLVNTPESSVKYLHKHLNSIQKLPIPQDYIRIIQFQGHNSYLIRFPCEKTLTQFLKLQNTRTWPLVFGKDVTIYQAKQEAGIDIVHRGGRRGSLIKNTVCKVFRVSDVQNVELLTRQLKEEGGSVVLTNIHGAAWKGKWRLNKFQEDQQLTAKYNALQESQKKLISFPTIEPPELILQKSQPEQIIHDLMQIETKITEIDKSISKEKDIPIQNFFQNGQLTDHKPLSRLVASQNLFIRTQDFLNIQTIQNKNIIEQQKNTEDQALIKNEVQKKSQTEFVIQNQIEYNFNKPQLESLIQPSKTENNQQQMEISGKFTYSTSIKPFQQIINKIQNQILKPNQQNFIINNVNHINQIPNLSKPNSMSYNSFNELNQNVNLNPLNLKPNQSNGTQNSNQTQKIPQNGNIKSILHPLGPNQITNGLNQNPKKNGIPSITPMNQSLNFSNNHQAPLSISQVNVPSMNHNNFSMKSTTPINLLSSLSSSNHLQGVGLGLPAIPLGSIPLSKTTPSLLSQLNPYACQIPFPVLGFPPQPHAETSKLDQYVEEYERQAQEEAKTEADINLEEIEGNRNVLIDNNKLAKRRLMLQLLKQENETNKKIKF